MLLTLLLIVLIVALMVGVNALYVAGEFAVVSARKARIVQAANRGSRAAKALLPVMEDPHRLDNYIAASQVGITLSSIVLGIYGQRQVTPLLAPLLARLPLIDSETAAVGVSATLILIIFTTLQVVFGELVPKSLAIQYPERVAQATVYPMRWSADWLLRPLIIVLNGSGAALLKLLGMEAGGGHQHVHSPEEIQLLIQQSYRGGLLDERGQRLLTNAFRISDVTVGQIAVPRTQIDALDAATPAGEALRRAVSSRHTRLPVYEGRLDKMIGFVHIKDLYRHHKNSGGAGEVRDIVRKAAYVPETAPLKQVWETLREQGSYLAIVVDEFGGAAGMVTWEDLLEELFGELRDEFDEAEEPLIRPLGEPGAYLLRGETPIAYLNTRFNLHFTAQRVYTVGGLLISRLQRMPQPGDAITINEVTLRVESMRGQAVESVRLQLPPDSAHDAAQDAASAEEAR